MSLRAFAKHMGYSSDNAVRKARDTGRLKPDAFFPDGSVNVEIAEVQWRKNTDSQQQRNPPPKGDASTQAPASNPNTTDEHESTQQYSEQASKQRKTYAAPDDDDDEHLEDHDLKRADLQEANRTLKVEQALTARIHRVALEKSVLDRKLTNMTVETIFREFREAMYQFAAKAAPNLAAKYGVSEHTVYIDLDAGMKAHLKDTVDRNDALKTIIGKLARCEAQTRRRSEAKSKGKAK